MQHRWGCQCPNGEPFDAGDIVDTFGDGFYVLMQGEFNRLPALREKAPGAFIMGRFYLPNWYTTDPEAWANNIADILNEPNHSDPLSRRNRDLLDAYTWANEQNLKVESGGAIGSSPGDMIKPGQYEIITDWNMRFLDRADQIMPEIPRVFPAYAMGNSDDQNDGAGVGLEISQPVVKRCDYGAIHPYWSPDRPIDDEWYGLGRIKKQLPFFPQLVLVTETGNFAVARQDAPEQYVQAGYYMQGFGQIAGFAYFIWSDPTKKHQDNDMSRNPKIREALKGAVKTPRPTEWAAPVVPVEPPPEPEPTPDTPQPIPLPSDANQPLVTTPGRLLIGYQVWQWSSVATVANYDHLKRDMDQIGAVILSDKYSDSDVLQGQFDNDAMAVKSIQVMKDRRQWCEDNGFIYIPWDVPRAIPVNNDPFEGARQEALFHADVCNQVGLRYRVSDLEFYPSFFGYSIERNGRFTDFFNSMAKRNDAAELYYKTFAENSDTKTILQPDPRQWGVIQFERLTKYLYSILWQSYAYWFQVVGDGRPHAQIIQDSISKSAQLEMAHRGLCLYCETGTPRDTPPAQAREMLSQAANNRVNMVFVYKAPVTPALHPVLREFAGRLGVDMDNDSITDVNNGLWHYGQQAENIATQLEALRDRARKLGYGWMGNNIDAAVMAARASGIAAKASSKIPKE